MTPPYAIVLGSGTSNGVPMLGATYPPEFLAEPKNHRTRCSLLLVGPEGNVLVDCTPEMRLQLTRESVTDLDAVLITHTHADHVMGMDDLRSICMLRQKELPIYASPESQVDIRRIYPYAFKQAPEGLVFPRFQLLDVPPIVQAGGLDIETLWVEHGSLMCMAVRVGDFAYVTDVSAIPPDAWDRLQGLETLVLDAVRERPHPNHFHRAKAIDVAQQLGATTTFFTHLSDEYDHYAAEADLPPGIKLAYDGLRIAL